jgi:hypothetical protein
MKNCAKECIMQRQLCKNTECRLYIDHPPDYNCTSIAIQKHGPMTLEEIGVRHHISTVRAKQLIDGAIAKLKKTLKRENTI